MSTELTPVSSTAALRELSALATESSQYDDMDIISEIAGSGYLPRMQLCSAKTDACMSGAVPMNNYALVLSKEDFLDLGREVDAFILAFRPRALDMSRKAEGIVVSSCDVNSATFQDIKERAPDTDSGCQFGPELLLWVPIAGQFATFFLGSKSARLEGRKIIRLKMIGKVVVFKSKPAANAKHKWQTPITFTSDAAIVLPSVAEAQKAKEKFLNPTEREDEEAPQPVSADVVRDR